MRTGAGEAESRTSCGTLERCARRDLDRAPCGDLHGLAGLGIAAGPCGSLDDVDRDDSGDLKLHALGHLLDDDAVTVRERDSMAQERIPLAGIEGWLAERLPAC